MSVLVVPVAAAVAVFIIAVAAAAVAVSANAAVPARSIPESFIPTSLLGFKHMRSSIWESQK